MQLHQLRVRPWRDAYGSPASSSALPLTSSAAERMNLSAQALIAIIRALVDACLGRIDLIEAAVFHRRQIRHHYIRTGFRSEEHTSELQSLRHLVCRLLL